MTAEDDEDSHGECVSENEFSNTGENHGDAAEEVEGTAEGSEGCDLVSGLMIATMARKKRTCSASSAELQEGKHGDLEGD